MPVDPRFKILDRGEDFCFDAILQLLPGDRCFVSPGVEGP